MIIVLSFENRCGAQDLPFLFNSYKHGAESLNLPNDCSGAQVSLKPDPYRQIMEICGIQHPVTAKEKEAVGEQIVTAFKTKKQVCPPKDIMDDDYAEIDIRIEVEEKKRQKLTKQEPIEPQVQELPKPHMKPEDIANMKKYQSHLFPVARIENNEFPWISYIFNAQNPVASRVRCEVCFQNKDKLHLSQNYLSDFALEKGALRGTNLHTTHVLVKTSL